MLIPQAALDLENQEQLADAYKILKQLWLDGTRNRELGLHLFFLAWFGLIEPKHLTGFDDTDQTRHELNQMIKETHSYFEPEIYQDAEILFAFGLMADMFWFMLEDATVWESRGKKYQKIYRLLAPKGLDTMIFHNRGAYGDYYSGHAKLENGY